MKILRPAFLFPMLIARRITQVKKNVYLFLITINPTPTAPRITRTPTGEAGAGVAVGQGVGAFTVDFTVVFTVVTVVWGTVVVAVVSSGERTSDAVTVVVLPAVTATFCDHSLYPALRTVTKGEVPPVRL